jgi:hypothetical protein
MRSLLSLILVASSLFTGCIFGCGFEGEGDRTYRRGNEALILCTNGGFVLTTETGYTEGRYVFDGTTTTATLENTAQVVFELTDNYADGTASTPALGATAWQSVTLDQVDLDHAHLQCKDLEARDWWTRE